MKCPKCGSALDTGFNCTKCGYRWQDGVKQPELTTAEMLLLLAEMERKEILEPTPSQCVDRWVEMYFEEKHRADVAEEALRLACNDVRHNYYMTGTEALIDNYKQQAEARLKELQKED